MGFLLKIGSLLGIAKKPLELLNGLLNGKKTYIGGVLIILPGIICLIQMALDLAPLDLSNLSKLAKSSCIQKIGEGLAAIGIGHKLVKSV